MLSRCTAHAQRAASVLTTANSERNLKILSLLSLWIKSMPDFRSVACKKSSQELKAESQQLIPGTLYQIQISPVSKTNVKNP